MAAIVAGTKVELGKMTMKTKTIRVALNGTATNPFRQLGLLHNPFPQTANARWDAACMLVQSLGGEPIPDQAYIRKTLEGFSPAFIELCCRQFRVGKYVVFTVTWPEEE